MTPAFSSWHDFFAMSHYAPYVWSVVIITIVVLGCLILQSHYQRVTLKKEIKRQIRQQQRIEQAKQAQKQQQQQWEQRS